MSIDVLIMLPRDLDPLFTVTAHFYEIAGPVDRYRCRSVLEIARNGSAHREPDAIVVMMNPGRSHPIGEATVGGAELAMVLTKCDDTQYQVMRVMEIQGWALVRVLNLSDLRNPRHTDFFEDFGRFEAEHENREHSIFSPRRAAELCRNLCRSPGAPIIVAWEIHRKLQTLATLALEALVGEPLVGKRGAKGGWRYWHPLPRNANQQTEWLRSIVEQLAINRVKPMRYSE